MNSAVQKCSLSATRRLLLSKANTKVTQHRLFCRGASVGFDKTGGATIILCAGMGASVAALCAGWAYDEGDPVKCEAPALSRISEEPKTGITFPFLVDGLTFVGAGVRVKYGFVKVYAVGTYVDPVLLKGMGPADVDKALLDPGVSKTIRIVMNRGLSVEKYSAAIVEALKPRMNGQDLEKLEEFKAMNPPGDLIEGSELIMTIRGGDVMMYRTAAGMLGIIRSEIFCRAMCDVFYGSDPVSPPHKTEVIKGIAAL